jgi:hypothetical protein
MTDIRDLLLNDDFDEEKVAEDATSSDEGHLKVAEQLEALSEDETMTESLLKVALFKEIVEDLEKQAGDTSGE